LPCAIAGTFDSVYASANLTLPLEREIRNQEISEVAKIKMSHLATFAPRFNQRAKSRRLETAKDKLRQETITQNKSTDSLIE
jgi:hypothetical protein